MKFRNPWRQKPGYEEYPTLRRMVKALSERTPYWITRRYPPDLPTEALDIIKRVGPYTLTSPARLVETVLATEYVARSGVPGSIVECGVWRGGSMMAAALTLMRLDHADRDLYLFDTFEGMTRPSGHDIHEYGVDPHKIWESKRDGESNEWVRVPLESVAEAMRGTGYDRSKVHLVKGPVEETLPAAAPEEIALLQLDTDFYESTRHELEYLYPRLAVGGVLVLDDYGSWRGVRKAADDYFAQKGIRMYLSYTDATARSGIKQADP